MATIKGIDFGDNNPKAIKVIFHDIVSPESIKAISEHIKKAFEPFQKAVAKFTQELEKLPESTRILAEYGWYLPFDIHPPIINYYVKELKEGNVAFVDEEMVAFLDQELHRIEDSLIFKFPHRKAPLLAAINAHRNANYYLSIPVFFIQIEGICLELTGKRFFKISGNQTKGYEPATAEWITSQQAGEIFNILLEPLKHTGIVRGKQDIQKPIGINRHDVLHGDSIDYGENKLNSYKALSLLNYLADTVYRVKDILNRQK